jgi:trimeric autotransporter adhesin
MIKKYTLLLLLIGYQQWAQAQGGTTVNGTVYFGQDASQQSSNNVHIGQWAGGNSGSVNVHIGYAAGQYNNAGKNAFVGFWSGFGPSQGSDNSFHGYYSGMHSEGSYNVYMGSSTGRYQSGNYNVYLGAEAGSGSGAGAGDPPRTGNTLAGYQAGYANGTSYITAFGFKAGYSNYSGSYNSFFGTEAGYSNSTGSDNVLVGYRAGYYLNGSNNVVVGTDAGSGSSYGNGNTYLGKDAGVFNKGHGNIFLGYRSGHEADYSNNKLAIGQSVNKFVPVFGDLGTRQLAVNVYNDTKLENISLSNQYQLLVNGGLFATAHHTLSDDGFKDDIDEISNALTILEGLQVRSYSQLSPSNSGITLPEGYVYGILAEGVNDAKLMKEGYRGYKAIDNNGLVALLVKSVQELSSTNAQLQDQIDLLRNMVSELGAKINTPPAARSAGETTSAKLGSLKASPNPVKEGGETIVHYSIAETVSTATLVVATASGMPLSTTPGLMGNGSVTVNTMGFVPGVYLCTLQIGTGIIDTVRIVVE